MKSDHFFWTFWSSFYYFVQVQEFYLVWKFKTNVGSIWFKGIWNNYADVQGKQTCTCHWNRMDWIIVKLIISMSNWSCQSMWGQNNSIYSQGKYTFLTGKIYFLINEVCPDFIWSFGNFTANLGRNTIGNIPEMELCIFCNYSRRVFMLEVLSCMQKGRAWVGCYHAWGNV